MKSVEFTCTRRTAALTVALIGAVAVSAHAGLPNPLLQYTFDEGAGPALDTGTGVPSNGDLLGGAVRSTDTPAGFSPFSVSFLNDDPYAHVLADAAPKLNGLSELTLTTWLKVDTYLSGNNRLSAKQAGTANFDGFSWNMNATPNSGTVGPDNFRLGMFLGGSAGFGFAFSDDDVGAVEWTFLAATYNSVTGAVNFYSGGVDSPVVQVGTTQTIMSGVLDAGTARYGVGFTDAAPAANTSVIGLQDDVRVYNFAFSASDLEIIRLQNIPEPAGALAVLALVGLTQLRRRRGVTP